MTECSLAASLSAWRSDDPNLNPGSTFSVLALFFTHIRGQMQVLEDFDRTDNSQLQLLDKGSPDCKADVAWRFILSSIQKSGNLMLNAPKISTNSFSNTVGT